MATALGEFSSTGERIETRSGNNCPAPARSWYREGSQPSENLLAKLPLKQRNAKTSWSSADALRVRSAAFLSQIRAAPLGRYSEISNPQLPFAILQTCPTAKPRLNAFRVHEAAVRGLQDPASSCRWTQRDNQQQGARSRSSSNFRPRLGTVIRSAMTSVGGCRNRLFDFCRGVYQRCPWLQRPFARRCGKSHALVQSGAACLSGSSRRAPASSRSRQALATRPSALPDHTLTDASNPPVNRS